MAATLTLAAATLAPSTAEAADGKSIFDLFRSTRSAITENSQNTRPNQIDPRISFPVWEIKKGVRITVGGIPKLSFGHQELNTPAFGISASF